MAILWLLLIVAMLILALNCPQTEAYNQYNKRKISDYTTGGWGENSIWQVIGRVAPLKPGFVPRYDHVLEQDMSRGPNKPSTPQGYLYRARSPNGNYITLNGTKKIKQGEIRRVSPGSMTSEDVYYYKVNLDSPPKMKYYWTLPYDKNLNMSSIYDYANAVDFRTGREAFSEKTNILYTPSEIENKRKAKTFLAIETKISDPDIGTYPRLRGNRFRYNKAERSTRPRIVLGMEPGVVQNSKRSCGGGDPFYSPGGKLLGPKMIS